MTVNVSSEGGSSTPSATQHTIYFEFTDNTNTTITAYYDSSFISNAITATSPLTYNNKIITSASLDGVIWYEPANIPLNTELIDFTKCKKDTSINSSGEEEETEWYYASDFTVVDHGMTFTYIAGIWTYIGLYDSSKNVISAIWVYNDGTPDPNDENLATGILNSSKMPSNTAYVRLASSGNQSDYMSLIRTA